MLSASGIRDSVRSTKTYRRWREFQRSVKAYVEQARPVSYPPSFSEDPLAKRGLDVFRTMPDGLRFELETRRKGAWQVAIDVEYEPPEAARDTFLTWRFDVDPLAAPMGPESYSVRLKPGRHTYTSYLSLQQTSISGKITIETATDDGWNVKTASVRPSVNVNVNTSATTPCHSNANQSTLIECWVDDLQQITRRGYLPNA